MSSSDETRQVLDRAPCGLMQTDDRGVFLHANAVFCRWVGYAEVELVGKRRFQDLLTVGARIFHQTHWTPLLQIQGSVAEVKLQLIPHGGAPIPMVLNAIRRDEAGAFVHDMAAFLAHDRDRYEQELVHARKRLEALHDIARDRAQYAEQMIGIVSHDLRTPLSAIRAAAEVVASAGAAAIDRSVPRILRAVDRSTRLISDLLDFTQARIGTGLAVAVAPIDLHRVASEIVDELRAANPTRTLVHLASGEGQVLSDEARIGQVVGNLVANAIAYGEPAAPITIVTDVRDVCTVSVHNVGTPIPPAIAGSIFDAMTRGTTKGSGARSVGLGLFIVREIARAHGGTASVTSSAEQGTTFTVAFPRR